MFYRQSLYLPNFKLQKIYKGNKNENEEAKNEILFYYQFQVSKTEKYFSCSH